MKFEKLKNIVSIHKGKKPSLVDIPDENSVRVLQIDDLRNDLNPKFTNDKTGVLAKEDDVLITWDGANAGTIGYGKSGYIGSTIALLRKKQPDVYSTRFLGIFLQTKYQYLRSKSTGATIPHISRKALEELEVPAISLNDQLRIASLLTKAERLIARRKESIRLLDEFLRSVFLEMFGDVKSDSISLSSICLVNPKKSEIASLENATEVSFVPMASVSENGDVDLSETRTIENVKNGFTYFRENDVVFAKITPCMENGKGAIMRNLKNRIGFGTTEFHVLRPIEGVSTSAWLYHLTMQDSFRKMAEQNMTGSAGQKRVPTVFFDRYKVNVPPLPLQTQFARLVEKTEALKAQYRQSLQELENLYGSLSQRAFRGEM